MSQSLVYCLKIKYRTSFSDMRINIHFTNIKKMQKTPELRKWTCDSGPLII